MRNRTLALHGLLVFVLLLTACASAAPEPSQTPPLPTLPVPTATLLEPTPTLSTPPERLELFTYDTEAPLDVSIGSESEVDGIRIISMSYASPMGDAVPAILVIPAGEGPFPAVLYLHCGHSASCDKSQFGYEAVEMARRGVASLAINGPLVRMSLSEFDPEPMFIYTVMDIRRGIDFLSTLPEIDVGRIGFVGHSYGATTGGILAGVEARIMAYVFMAGSAQVSVTAGPASIAHLDAVNYIPYASHAQLFFQFAEEDRYVPVDDANFLYETASEPKTVTWYACDHDFNSEAMVDRIEWLVEVLTAGP